MRCWMKIKQHWNKYQRYGLYQTLFVEPQREKVIRRKGRSRLADILIYSKASEYFALRSLYNLPIGFAISWLLYDTTFYSLNFLDFNDILSEMLRWAMILGFTFAFALNPFMRAALLVGATGSLHSAGQGVASAYMFTNTLEGPLSNFKDNFIISANVTICHVEIQARIIKHRIELEAGPLEALFEKNFGNATSIGKKLVKTLNSLVRPFLDELDSFGTEEDNHLEAIIDTAKELADRQLITEGGMPDQSVVKRAKPVWERLKSQIFKSIVHRYERRCKYLYAKLEDTCHKNFEDMQSRCYDIIPFPIHYFTCSRMNALSLCQPNQVNQMANKFCELGQRVESAGREEHDTLFSSDLDHQLSSLTNVSKQIEHQLLLNIHFQAIEQPEMERGYTIEQLKSEAVYKFEVMKELAKTIALFGNIIVIIFLYLMVTSGIDDIRKYLKDVEYKNVFVTSYFWRIDAKRKRARKMYLRELTSDEFEHYGLLNPIGSPTKEERKGTVRVFVRYFILAFAVSAVLTLDIVSYQILDTVVETGHKSHHLRGHHTLSINVKGNGLIADLLRKVLAIDYHKQLDEHISNEQCLQTKPFPPGWTFNTTRIILPLIAMFILQVCLNYLIERFIRLCVFGWVFPRVAKRRVIHLYNKIMKARKRLGKN